MNYGAVEDDSFIFDLVHNAYNKLPKKGKPIPANGEWTHLAAIIVEFAEPFTVRHEVVALGTGTKCLGRSKLVGNGSAIRDSHAEVIARRCFMFYLYECLMAFYGMQPKNELTNIFEKSDGGRVKLKAGVKFIFLLTHPPCGDASIFPKLEEDLEDEIGNLIDLDGNSRKRPATSSEGIRNDIHRTGAKCVPGGSLQDPHLPKTGYHVTGALRSKPGRGDPTLSMSCSDKMLKWSLLGVQGSLLSYFIEEPIWFDRIVFTKCKFDKTAFERALSVHRFETLSGFHSTKQPVLPSILVITKDFEFSKNMVSDGHKTCKPAASAICFCRYGKDTTNFKFDAISDGYKLGVTKKQAGTLKAACFISSAYLFVKFCRLARYLRPEEEFLKVLPVDASKWNYALVKNASLKYNSKRLQLLATIFNNWLLKPAELNNFIIENASE